VSGRHRPVLLVVLGIVLFWCGVAVAAAHIPGYRADRDTVSALAADDARSRTLAIWAAAALATAHTTTAVVLCRRGLRAAGAALGAATVAGWCVLWLPIHCPHGAAGCSGPLSGRVPDAAAIAHRDATVLYVVLFCVALAGAVAGLIRRDRPLRAAVLAALLLAGAGLALGLRHGVELGLWERAWLSVNSVALLVLVTAPQPSPSGVSGHERAGMPRNAGRSAGVRAALGGVLAAVAVVPWAAQAQPAYSWRTDLASNLAAHGVRWPVLGRVVIVAVAVAYLGAAAALSAAGQRWTAAAGGLAGLGAAGVATVSMTCPRGAHGCSGPNSGRSWPRPLADVVHRDLVVALEVGSVLLLVGLAVAYWRTGQTGNAALAAALSGASVVLLGRQQAGHDIGFWQLGWLAVTLSAPALVASGRHLLPQTGQGAGQDARDVHLRDAHLGTDLGLGQPAEEPQLNDLLLTRGERVEQRAQHRAVDE
jgi:hypothetical protein